jgi:hypothetical protein
MIGIVKTFSHKNTDVEVLCEKTCLHILDRDTPGSMSLTNAVDREYIEKIKRVFNKTINHIYLYHTDGVITQWKRNNFCYVSYEDPAVYTPYKALMLEKRKKWA